MNHADRPTDGFDQSPGPSEGMKSMSSGLALLTRRSHICTGVSGRTEARHSLGGWNGSIRSRRPISKVPRAVRRNESRPDRRLRGFDQSPGPSEGMKSMSSGLALLTRRNRIFYRSDSSTSTRGIYIGACWLGKFSQILLSPNIGIFSESKY